MCATSCQYTASGIARDLKDHAEHRPALPQLTAAQYTALDQIAQCGARRYERRGAGPSVLAGTGKTIHAKPFGVLQEHRLIRTEHTDLRTRRPPHHGHRRRTSGAGYPKSRTCVGGGTGRAVRSTHREWQAPVNFAPDGLVLVTPRHLAGGRTNPLGDVIGPLVHLVNWPHAPARTTGGNSHPCHRRALTLPFLEL
ncbi:hypothetical protein ABZ746_28690 [Streptomyces sp. NPDC020096]